MAKKVITPAGIKFIYSINDICLKISYTSRMNLDNVELNLISNLKRFELVELIRQIIVERWKVVKEHHANVVPSNVEIAFYCYGVKAKDNAYLLNPVNQTHQQNLTVLVDAYDYFTGLYQHYIND